MLVHRLGVDVFEFHYEPKAGEEIILTTDDGSFDVSLGHREASILRDFLDDYIDATKRGS